MVLSSGDHFKHSVSWNKKLKPFLENPKNAELKTAIDELTSEINKIGKNGVEKITATGNTKQAGEIYKEIFNSQVQTSK